MSYRAVAQRFGDGIARNDYGATCAIFTEELQSSTTAENINNTVTTMTAYAMGSLQEAQVMDAFTLKHWPGKQQDDLAVVHIALNGDSFSNAVALTLAPYGVDVLIRHLEWGRL